MQPSIRIEEYDYPLAETQIAKYPLPDRDASRLLVFDGRIIKEGRFKDLPALLPSDSVMVFNDTKVFHARLLFRKESGAVIELFCLEPRELDFQQAFASGSGVIWKCMVGNARRWNSGVLKMQLTMGENQVELQAEKLALERGLGIIRFTWNPAEISFGEIVDTAGAIPIPPYLKRAAEEEDKLRYQTHYARLKGSVAAPTAGLHFTPAIMDALNTAGVDQRFLTLHVGAGTFKPVVSLNIDEHEMHPESFSVSLSTLEWLMDVVGRKSLVSVGTTTVRTLESLYWMGVDSDVGLNTQVGQWRPYGQDSSLTALESIGRLVVLLKKKHCAQLNGITRLMIKPGYRFRLVDAMVTNFHQPKSTLLLLVAAMVGNRWREVYDFAATHGFRFLSYGDSCFFIKAKDSM